MTGNAKTFGIRDLKCRVESAPEHYPADKTTKRQKSKTERGSGSTKKLPGPSDELFYIAQHLILPCMFETNLAHVSKTVAYERQSICLRDMTCGAEIATGRNVSEHLAIAVEVMRYAYHGCA